MMTNHEAENNSFDDKDFVKDYDVNEHKDCDNDNDYFNDDDNAFRDFGDALKPTPITTKGVS